MKKTLLALLFLAATAAAAAPKPAPKQLSDLKGGRYAVKISGFLCAACARAAVAEVSQLKDVEDARADFDSEELVISVKTDRVLTLSTLRKALKRAAKRVNLDTRFEVEAVRYRPR